MNPEQSARQSLVERLRATVKDPHPNFAASTHLLVDLAQAANEIEDLDLVVKRDISDFSERLQRCLRSALSEFFLNETDFKPRSTITIEEPPKGNYFGFQLKAEASPLIVALDVNVVRNHKRRVFKVGDSIA